MKRLTHKKSESFFRVLFFKNECTQHCVVECRVRFMYEDPTAMRDTTHLRKSFGTIRSSRIKSRGVFPIDALSPPR